MIIFYLHYIIVFILSALTLFKKKLERVLAPLIFLLLLILPAFRGKYVSRDYTIYIHYFQKLTGNINYLGSERPLFYEPANYFIPLISKFLVGNAHYIYLSFGIFAFLGIYFKLRAFYLSNSFFLSVILYSSNFFLLHEMTQIRIGVATGIFLFSLKHLYNREFFRYLGFVLAACFFHYSSILFLPLYFLNREKINLRLWGFLLLGVCLLSLFKINLISPHALGILSPKAEIYASNIKREISVWGNPGFLMQLFISLILLVKARSIMPHNRFFILMLKIYLVAQFCFLLLAPIPVFAERLSQQFGIVQICLFPCLIFAFPKKSIGYGLVILISLVFFYNYIIRVQLFHDYYTWWQ